MVDVSVGGWRSDQFEEQQLPLVGTCGGPALASVAAPVLNAAWYPDSRMASIRAAALAPSGARVTDALPMRTCSTATPGSDSSASRTEVTQ
jgi:hypothetical protein